MTDETVIVCGDTPGTPHSVRVPCGTCGRQVWLSPALQDRAGRRLCQDCALSEDTTEIQVSAATLDELAEAWGCTADEAFARSAESVRRELGKELKRA